MATEQQLTVHDMIIQHAAQDARAIKRALDISAGTAMSDALRNALARRAEDIAEALENLPPF